MQPPKLPRTLFWAVWFVLVPLALAALTVWALKPGVGEVAASGFGKLRFIVQDQPVPSGIVLFTLYEMLLYHFRYYLPFAANVGLGGRADVPPELRRAYEQAAHLLDEVERVRDRNAKAIERNVPRSARDKLDESLESLKAAMDEKEFDPEAFQSAHEAAVKVVERHLGRWRKGELREYAESIGVAVGVALLLRAFVVEAFKIPSGSMLPTLQIQDHIFVNKFSYGPTVPFTKNRVLSRLPPSYGDVMVFEFPDPNPQNPRQDFIKRAIALPGDTLSVEAGHPIINGWRVPSCFVGAYEFHEGDETLTKRGDLFVEFLGEYSYLTLFEDDRFDGRQGPYQVEPGEVWVLGDNRNNSSDSRAWFGGRGGGVPFPNIKGRALFVWMSFGADGGITWDRLLANVMGRPRLPKEAPQALVAGIQKCLSARPPISETTPPRPKN
ncbi:MAG: signal peptidase I [Polyangiaceae bacterium]|nr:signal peptidase I [Polyangiaceae bacterium]